jgi:hypothetical protein
MRAFLARAVFGAGVLLAAAVATAPDAQAQSDILLRLRSGSPAGDRVRIDSAGGIVAMGTLGIGIIPATVGCGYRMMWYPFKGAFRAGTTDDGGACTYWDDANIGFYSWAGGNLTRASAFASFAFGDQVTVTGVDAVGFGASSTVSGTVGFSAGGSNKCTAFACVAIGWTNRAAGQGASRSASACTRARTGRWRWAGGRTRSTQVRSSYGDASTTDSLAPRRTTSSPCAPRAGTASSATPR